MSRSRDEEVVPDRLAAMLDEIDSQRRPAGWIPTQESLLDSRRPAVQADSVSDGRSAGHGGRGGARLHRRRSGRPARHADTGVDVRPHAPLLQGPAALRHAEIAPRRLAVLAMVFVVLVAGLVLGGRVVLARASATPQSVPTSAAVKQPTSAATGRASGSSFGTTGPRAAPAATQVVVQVVGQVRRPGVVSLRSGARVQDAVAAVGGALPSADLTAINLARVLSDGEQIQVPKPGQVPSTPPANPGGPGGTGGAAGANGAAAAPSGAPVNLNTADLSALDTLPGVGPVLAQRIFDWRTRNGRFSSVDELGEVSGIGDKMLQRLRPRVTV
ncbi:ComEA family DNA-binding protein [Dermatophilaceae bacterium Sec6.4]